MVFAALCVVTTKNVVHAALWLVIVLAGVAAQYILAAAEFVAVSPGARVHRRRDGAVPVRHHAHPGPDSAASAASTTGLGLRPSRSPLVLLGVLVVGRSSTPSTTGPLPDRGPTPTDGDQPTTFLSPYLVPFLALSFILLAAAIGAIVLARKD